LEKFFDKESELFHRKGGRRVTPDQGSGGRRGRGKRRCWKDWWLGEVARQRFSAALT